MSSITPSAIDTNMSVSKIHSSTVDMIAILVSSIGERWGMANDGE